MTRGTKENNNRMDYVFYNKSMHRESILILCYVVNFQINIINKYMKREKMKVWFIGLILS